MKMKMPTGVVVSQPSRLAYNQAPSTPLNEMFPQACSNDRTKLMKMTWQTFCQMSLAHRLSSCHRQFSHFMKV